MGGEWKPRGTANQSTSPWQTAKLLPGLPPAKDSVMAKSQKKSNKEVRKPKAEKPPKQNASQPSVKPGVLPGLDNMKR